MSHVVDRVNTVLVTNEEKWVPKVDLSHLTEKQKDLVSILLLQKCDFFSKDDCDVGDIVDFQMKINLSDETPVKEAYRHLPRNFYEEDRNYVNDLIINGGGGGGGKRIVVSLC